MAITRLTDKNPGKTIAEIRAGLRATPPTAVGLTLEELEENAAEMMTIATETAMALESLQEVQQTIANIPVQTRESLGIASYPSDPTDLPVPAAAIQLIEQKADYVDTDFTILEPATGNVYTLDYDPAKPVYRINLSANGVVQLDSLHGLTKAECLLYVKKTTGTATVTFRDATTQLSLTSTSDAVITTNGALEIYDIQKIADTFYIERKSMGVGAPQAANVAPPSDMINPLNFMGTQGTDENGKNVVLLKWDNLSGASWKLIRNTSPTATAPTLYESATYPTVSAQGTSVQYKDLGASSASSTTVLQDGVIYYYRLRVTKAGQETVWYTVQVRIN